MYSVTISSSTLTVSGSGCMSSPKAIRYASTVSSARKRSALEGSEDAGGDTEGHFTVLCRELLAFLAQAHTRLRHVSVRFAMKENAKETLN